MALHADVIVVMKVMLVGGGSSLGGAIDGRPAVVLSLVPMPLLRTLAGHIDVVKCCSLFPRWPANSFSLAG